MELRGPFDGFVEKAVRASTTCLIMTDHNRYGIDARAAGRMVLVRSFAERIVVLFNDEVVTDHPRQFRRDQIIYDPLSLPEIKSGHTDGVLRRELVSGEYAQRRCHVIE